ncbi:class II aldolase/adducin N-terminal domain protein [Leptospira fainei serovar Hurstbridge str. BUT 6]|uniref:Class II aldolase/adducin N-terminal domain protein n=1 Tax=Leptospira fainei serovar Hurstbridge str. BUT 6 TaxID=1193011 RepID=S3W3K8_9LEPT|nr:class II aldolase/adducin family protein [Leptospira fainei]EPG74882.1 class II aldolase/adducin N-terminal domain protein [Leptospira fainei serovar Hurstbridge str. BUT 6]
MKNLKFEAVRASIVAASVKLADLGFFAGIGGNLAVRIDSELMAVTPSASDYYSMNNEDICIVRINNLKLVEGTKEPTTESGMHAAFLTRRPDLQVSLHTHQPLASAVTLLGIDMPIEDPEARTQLGPSLRIVSYAPSGTPFLVSAFKKKVRKDTNGYLLRNHGIVCGAKSVEQAIANVQLAEEQSGLYLRSRIKNNPSISGISPLVLQQALSIL